MSLRTVVKQSPASPEEGEGDCFEIDPLAMTAQCMSLRGALSSELVDPSPRPVLSKVEVLRMHGINLGQLLYDKNPVHPE